MTWTKKMMERRAEKLQREQEKKKQLQKTQTMNQDSTKDIALETRRTTENDGQTLKKKRSTWCQ